MQWLFSNRDTVFIKYIVPVLLSICILFGFLVGSVQRADAFGATPIVISLLLGWLSSTATGALYDLMNGTSDPQAAYSNYVTSLPYQTVSKNGFFVSLELDSSQNKIYYAKGTPTLNRSNNTVNLEMVCGSYAVAYLYFKPWVAPCTGTIYYQPRFRSNIPMVAIGTNGVGTYSYPTFSFAGSADGSDNGSMTSAYSSILKNNSFVVSRNTSFTPHCLGVEASNYSDPNDFIFQFSFLSGFYFMPTKLLDIPNSDYYSDLTSRLGSIAGNYLYLHSDYDAEKKPNAYDTYLNTALVDETNMQYHNPVTGTTKTITDWQYNYANMSYSLTLEDESTVVVTWGNEYCSIIENGKTYCLYYLPADFEENRPCEHEWSITDTVEATCTYPGMTTFSCTKCGETKIEKVDPLGHDWLLTERVDGEPSSATDVTYQPWTQPVLTSDTDYGTVSAGSYNSNGNAPAWRALDGQKSAGGQSWEAAQGVYPAWWQWKLPVTLKMSHLKLTNKYSGSSYVTKSVSVYSDSAHTNLIASGDFPNSSLSVLEWDFTDPVITDTLYIVCEDSHSSLTNAYVGLGEVEITAEEQTLQEGTTTSGGYDLYRCSRCGQTYKDYGDNPPGDNAGSSGFFKGLGNLIKRAIAWVLDKLASLVEGLNSITDYFKSLVEEVKGYSSGFTEFISGVLGAVPSEVVTLIWFSIVGLVVVCVVLRFFR